MNPQTLTFFRFAIVSSCVSCLFASYCGANEHSIIVKSGTISTENRWAVIVGVSDYDSPGIEDLSHVNGDVWTLYETLRTNGRYPDENILVFVDEGGGDSPRVLPPTSRTLRRALPEFLGKLTSNDTVLFYFSGHGLKANGKAFMLLGDATSSESADNKGAFAFEELKNWLTGSTVDNRTACKARKKIVLLDMCHAGAAKSGAHKVIGAVEDEMKYARGLVTIASTGSNQLAYQWDERKQSVFSAHLDDALRGLADDNNNNSVDHLELYNYLSRHVPNTTAELHDGAPQEPRLLQGPKTSGVFMLTDSISSRSLMELVQQKKKALYRVEQRRSGNYWQYTGTAFAISSEGRKTYLATAAGTLIDDRGKFVGPERIRLLHESGGGRAIMPSDIFFDRKDASQSDLGVIEITNKRGSSQEPVVLNLIQDTSKLSSSPECASLGILKESCTKTKACLNESVFTSLPERLKDYLAYKPKKKRISIGAPLFVVSDDSGSGDRKVEYVVGICIDKKIGTNNHIAVRSDSLWELIAKQNRFYESTRGPQFSTKKSTEIAKERIIVPENHDAEYELASGVDEAFKNAIVLSTRKKFALAANELSTLRRNLQKAGKGNLIPWEIDVLEGSIQTQIGLTHVRNSKRTEARKSFQTAHVLLKSASDSVPRELLPFFLDARARNNLGLLDSKRGLNADKQEHLQYVHDRMINVLEQDQNGWPLTLQQRAQCHYLLAYTHRIIGRKCGGNPVTDLKKSYQILPSHQVRSQLIDLGRPPMRTQANQALVDIWDEFETLMNYWDSRLTTECDNCNLGCPVCG